MSSDLCTYLQKYFCEFLNLGGLERDPVAVYAAAVGVFSSWALAGETEVYKAPDHEIIKNIEALLIYAHQPAYNRKSKESAMGAVRYRIFNTGKFGALLPEVSGMYYLSE